MPLLTDYLANVYAYLLDFALSDLFWTNFETVYGTKYDFAKAEAIRSDWASNNFRQLPPIEVVSAGVLGSALGGYAASNNTIYLSEALLSFPSETIVAVMVEEIGHYLDAQVNMVDTPGDEGELFSAVVLGRKLGVGELKRIQAESDQGFLTTEEGQVVEIEMATLVKEDLFPTRGSWASNLTNVNGVLYFTVNDGISGYELWKSDGTEAGTVLVKDIRAGSSGSGGSGLRYLTNVNGVLYFNANDGISGYELWKSDGTEAGTVLVKDIQAGSGSSIPSNLTNMNGVLYFRASDGTSGSELWKSDGTAAGTVLVKDIQAGSSTSSARYLTNVNGVLYFRANNGTNGDELWKSDGTAAGTVLVKDIRAGFAGSEVRNLTNVNGVLYFTADDGISGHELWKSDGTAGGTVLVKDIRAGGSGSWARYLTNVNGVLYFSANNGTSGYELWKSDGTAVGTVLVKDIRAGSSGSGVRFLTNVNGVLYFSANDGISGYELWKSDGTEAGTVLVKDIRAGSSGVGVRYLTNVNEALYFTANNDTNGYELWKSDGTEAGTVLVKDIWAGSSSSVPVNLANVNGVLYLTASNDTSGRELWRSDGTEAGTVLVKDINQQGNSPTIFANANGVFYFRAFTDTSGHELWKSDGTEAGTVLVKDIRAGSGGSGVKNLTNVNEVLYFTALTDTNGYELWKSDGTEAGTVLVKDIWTGSSGSYTSNLTNVNGVLYFSANDGVSGYELWKSDGTEAGTVLIKDIRAGSSGSGVQNLTNVNGVLYFTALTDTNGYELWKSDGTEAGTVLVKDIRAGSSSSFSSNPNFPSNLTNVNGVLYFTANDGTSGYELWKSDGTEAGTVLVKDIQAGSSGSFARYLTNVNGVLYFRADNSANGGRELWKSDGTEAGTVLVKDIRAGFAGSEVRNLTNVNGVLYFTADDGISGHELWKSDGTTGGTVLVKDIRAGFGLYISNLTNVNGVLYFTADDGVNGVKIWTTDGTAENTRIADDMAVLPTGLVSFLDTLFFQAVDPDGVGVGLQRLNVTNNETPTITSGGTSSFAENGTGVVYTTVATSPEGDPIVFSFGGVDIGLFDTNANTGEVSFKTSPDFEAPVDAGGDNVYDITVTASDGVLSSLTQPVQITVTNVNEAPFVQTPLDDQTVNVGIPFNFTVPADTFGDEDGDTLSYTAVLSDGTTPLPGWLSFDDQSLVFSGTPSLGDAGTLSIGVFANDGTLSTFDIFDVVVSSEPGTIQFDSSSYSVNEDGTAVNEITLVRTGGSYGSVSVTVTPGNGTATSPADFDATPIVVNFANGETHQTVTIPVVDDDLVEGGETVILTLSNPSGGTTLGDQTTAVLTIIDNEVAPPGTPGIPFLVKDINSSPYSFGPIVRYLTAVGDTLFFNATSVPEGTELWKSDGTAAGTVLVDINPGDYSGSYPGRLTAVGDTLFFSATGGPEGAELWKSDGTTEGTVLVKDIRPGYSSSSPRNLTAVGDTLFFEAEANPSSNSTGAQLWKSDGTTEGTVLVKNLRPGSPWSFLSWLTAVGDTLFFTANSGGSGPASELWKSDGTAEGTVLLKVSTPSISKLTAVGNTLFFSADDGTTGRELWKSDGTAAGTVLVKDIPSGGYFGSDPSSLTAVGDTLFFEANNGTSGAELWKSDGTAEGTVLVKDINPGSGSSSPYGLTAVGDTFFFTANDGINGHELWKSDGTAEGTVLVKDINPGSGFSFPDHLTVVGSTLFFQANDGINGLELWRSDGTAEGTVLVQNINPSTSPYDFGESYYDVPYELTAVGNTLFFRTTDGSTGLELWALEVDQPANNLPPSAVNVLNPLPGLAENVTIGTGIKVAEIEIIDDGLGTNNLMLTGTDAADFVIRGAELFYIGSSPNFEVKNQYQVTVTVDDSTVGDTPDASANFILTILDVNEAPTITSGGTVNFAENGTGVFYTAVATDPEGDPIVFSFEGGDVGLFDTDANTGEVRFKTPPDFEAPGNAGGDNVYNITVTASDGVLGSEMRAVKIAVTDVNEVPTNINLSNNAIAEGVTNGTKIGLLAASDPDGGDSHTYTLSTSGVPFAIVGNELRTAGTIDFETQSSYSLTIQTRDAAGETFDKVFTVNISDVIEINNIRASVGDNVINGTAGVDRLSALNSGNTLNGLGGNDLLIGGSGDDILNGGAGADRMLGRGGVDFYQYDNFSDSPFARPDTLIGFTQSKGDRFDVNATIASARNLGVIAASSLSEATNAAGDSLSTIDAVFFQFGSLTYLMVDNGDNVFNANSDLFIANQRFGFKSGDSNANTNLIVADYFA